MMKISCKYTISIEGNVDEEAFNADEIDNGFIGLPQRIESVLSYDLSCHGKFSVSVETVEKSIVEEGERDGDELL